MNDFLNSVGYGQWILHALVLIPLAGVLLILALPSGPPATRRSP